MTFLTGEERRVLLVGEGNFSFTETLLKKLDSSRHTVQIISSCYQSFRELSVEIKNNALRANKLGGLCFTLL